MQKVTFYAVNKGRVPGVYSTWKECEAQVKGFNGAKYKKFMNASEAESFVNGLISTDKTSNQMPNENEDKPTSDKGKKRERIMIEDTSGWDVVYCDGACKANGKAGSVAGVGVWWEVNDPRNIAERCPGDQTNNRAELIAMLRILETTPRSKKPLLIKSDSLYSINCFTNWLSKWLQNDFKTAEGERVKNAGIIRYISAHLDARALFGQQVRLEYVKGHSGDPGNDGADAQANLGAMMPAVPDRQWEELEKELKEQIEKERQGNQNVPSGAPTDVDNNAQSIESPTKLRKFDREVAFQHPRSTPESMRVVSPPNSVSKTYVSNSSSTPPFKPPNLAPLSYSPAHLKYEDPLGPTSGLSLTSSPKIASPTKVSPLTKPSSPTKEVFSAQTTNQVDKPTLPKSPRTIGVPPSSIMSKTPKTISISSSQEIPSRLSSESSSLSPRRINTATSIISPRRTYHTGVSAARERSGTPTKAIATPALVGKSDKHKHPIVVNKEDIDFNLYVDCVLDDDDLWKDIY